MKKNVHVTHRKDGNWAVITERSQRAVKITKTQEKGIEVATPIAKNNKAELVIHDRKNHIRDKDSFGKDPNQPKDKRH
ncbi:MAG: DUF2188 domain-containing protein [Patescibacteria group bacterium]